MNNSTKPLYISRAGSELTDFGDQRLGQNPISLVKQFPGLSGIPIYIKDGHVSIFGYGLDLTPVLVEFIQHIQVNSGFCMHAPVHKSEIRKAVADINSETRKALAELNLPSDFRLIKPDGQRLIISRGSLDDIERKIIKLRAKKKTAKELTTINSAKDPKITRSEENVGVASIEAHPDEAESVQSVVQEKITKFEAAKEIWEPKLRTVVRQIDEYKSGKKKYPDFWGSEPQKVGEYLLLYINRMMDFGIETMRGISDEERKDFCAKAFNGGLWLDIDRKTQRQLLAALTAITVLDTGASLISGSYQQHAIACSRAAVFGL